MLMEKEAVKTEDKPLTKKKSRQRPRTNYWKDRPSLVAKGNPTCKTERQEMRELRKAAKKASQRA